METTVLLKQEINQTLDSLHDFAKWKLIVTAALVAAALGLNGADAGKIHPSWLLLLVPYACAYVDLNCYQYLVRITVIARCLRTRGQDPMLKWYERLCEELRVKYGVFNLGKDAQVGVSLVVSISPVIAVYELFSAHLRGAAGFSILVWMVGVALIIFLWRYFTKLNHYASEGTVDEKENEAGAANV